MKSYTLNDIRQSVRIAIDQNTNDGALAGFGDADTLTLDEIITANVERGAQLVLVNAPHRLLGRGEPLPTPIEWESAVGYGAGYFQLPDDFLRLIAFRMSDWDYAVHTPILDTAPDYMQLRSRYRGISGNPQRPKVALAERDAGLYLEFYTCTEGATASCISARYLPYPKVKDDALKLPDKLYEAVVYSIASLTAQTYLLADQATLLAQTAKSLME